MGWGRVRVDMSEAPQHVPVEPGAADRLSESVRPLAALLAAATVPRRRETLSTLLDHGELPLSDLARRVAAREAAVTVGQVSPTGRDRVLASLHHTHLPKLVDAGLVTRGRDAEDPLVSPGAWARNGATFDAIEAAFSTGETDAVVATLLADSRRGRVVSRLRASDGPVELESLARAVAAAEAPDDAAPTEDEVSSVAVSLHHVHLPKLADVGVLTYDPAEREAAFVDVPPVYDAVAAGADVRQAS